MSFSQSISGLNAASGDLDVIGNNIANSATNGFKASSAAFADMFAGSKVGLGVKMQNVTQNFNDGSVSNTGRDLDVAISQKGFFRMVDEAGAIYYSRNGQFRLDENRNLVNMTGLKITGYPADGDPATIQTGADPVPLSIPNKLMSAKQTSAATMVVNLNSSEKKPDIATFDASKTDSYNKKGSITVYDSQGNEHNIGLYFIKDPATENKWNIRYVDSSIPATIPPPTTGVASLAGANAGSLTFDKNGKLVAATAPIEFTTGAIAGTDAVRFTIDFTNSLQQNTPSNIVSANQDGYRPGDLVGFKINTDGTVIGSYSNEQQQPIGQIVLANFSNAEGLAPHGDNMWVTSRSSGPELVGIAGTGNFGTLTNGALEASNVDLGKELVSMILAQRNYQSNAQSIKTQDQILSSLVNLR